MNGCSTKRKHGTAKYTDQRKHKCGYTTIDAMQNLQRTNTPDDFSDDVSTKKEPISSAFILLTLTLWGDGGIPFPSLSVPSLLPSVPLQVGPSPSLPPLITRPPPLLTIRYDTRCYFNVRSKADISQLNLPHGTDN